MLRWWFVDGVSKSSTGVDASSATSSVADGELSVDAMRIAPIYNNQSVPGYEECAGGSGHDVVWERERGGGRQRGRARGGGQLLGRGWGTRRVEEELLGEGAAHESINPRRRMHPME